MERFASTEVSRSFEAELEAHSVAYWDVEGNVMCGDDGRPRLIDGDHFMDW